MNATCQENLLACHCGQAHSSFDSPAVVSVVNGDVAAYKTACSLRNCLWAGAVSYRNSSFTLPVTTLTSSVVTLRVTCFPAVEFLPKQIQRTGLGCLEWPDVCYNQFRSLSCVNVGCITCCYGCRYRKGRIVKLTHWEIISKPLGYNIHTNEMFALFNSDSSMICSA